MENPRRFIRFVVPVRNESTGHAAGIFQVRQLCRRRDLPPPVDRRIRRAFRWFGDELPVPPVVKKRRDALSWFRREPGEPTVPASHEALRRAFALASALRQIGIPIETVQTDDPGRVLYVDRWQVVAVPRVATPTGGVRFGDGEYVQLWWRSSARTPVARIAETRGAARC